MSFTIVLTKSFVAETKNQKECGDGFGAFSPDDAT